FATIEPIDRWLHQRPRLLALVDRPEIDVPALLATAATNDHVVLVGHGRVGGAIAATLDARSLPYIVVERDRRIVDAVRIRGETALFGDAARTGVLAAAHVDSARLLII